MELQYEKWAIDWADEKLDAEAGWAMVKTDEVRYFNEGYTAHVEGRPRTDAALWHPKHQEGWDQAGKDQHSVP